MMQRVRRQDKEATGTPAARLDLQRRLRVEIGTKATADDASNDPAVMVNFILTDWDFASYRTERKGEVRSNVWQEECTFEHNRPSTNLPAAGPRYKAMQCNAVREQTDGVSTNNNRRRNGGSTPTSPPPMDLATGVSREKDDVSHECVERGPIK
jgi:hypothetical protein